MTTPLDLPADTPATAAGPRRPPGRPRLLGYAALQVVLFIPELLMLLLWVLGGVLMVVWIGAPLVLAAAGGNRWLAEQHRRMAERVLGTPAPTPYLLRSGRLSARLRAIVTDGSTWRDIGWLFVTLTVGFALSLFTLLLAIIPVAWWIWYYAGPQLARVRALLDRAVLCPGTTARLEQRVERLTESRADVVDHSAAELRRVERDLHDGAQARLVALSISLGLAESALDDDPATARRLVAEARESSTTALAEIRDVVRGIHPPVLADRGLDGAVRALALDMAIPVTVRSDLARGSGRPPAPVESAVYFAVAECLANLGKHAGADNGWIDLTHTDGRLSVVVGDDGRGGADPDRGTGIRGMMRRLDAFDGSVRLSSPVGGPTLVTLEVPCALSSPRTTPCSGPA